MKRVVSVSLGSASRDHRASVHLLGERFELERIGTDGSIDRATAKLRELDGTVDALGLGGIDVYLYAGKKRFALRDGLRLLGAVTKTPIVDGSGLKNTLEREAVRYLRDELHVPLQGAKVLMVSALDRFGMAQAFVDFGADVLFGDFIFALDLDKPVRGLAEFEALAERYLPDACKLPFQFFYPTGKKQDRPPQPKYPEYYAEADIIAGDFHFMRQFMPARLDGKLVLTNTVTERDIEELRSRGVACLVTTTPDFGGRSFGTNVLEAALLASLGKRWDDVTPEDYANSLARMALRPRVLDFRGDARLVGLAGRLLARQPVESDRTSGGPALRRVLGIPGLMCIGLGTMLGGIFATIGVGTLEAGPGVIVSFLLSGLACVFVSLCYAELASMVPIAGSAYTYAYATLGEFVAWIIGWDLILEYGISVAPIAASWSGYAQAYLQNFGFALPDWAKVAHLAVSGGGVDLAHSQVDVLAVLVVLAITALIAIGIQESTSVNGVLVVVQAVAIVAFVVGLAGAVHPGNYHPAFPHGAHGVVTGAALVFFAYIGFDTVTVASEEARQPERDVPRAVIGSLVIGAFLYVAIAVVTVGIVPWAHIDKDAGMADAVRRAGNNPLLSAVVTAAAISGTTTVMLTSLLGQVRIFYVMARDRMLPAFVARVNARTRTPLITTLTTGIIVAILAGIVPLDVLLSLVNIGTLSAFAIVCAGVLVLRYTRPDAKRPFRAPLGVPVAVLGCGMCLYLMIGGLSGGTWLRFVLWFVVGVAVYASYGYRHSLLRPRADS